MTIYMEKGHKFYTKYGEYICRLSRDVHYYEPVTVDVFEDWQVNAPEPGDPIHEAVALALHRRDLELYTPELYFNGPAEIWWVEKLFVKIKTLLGFRG